MRTEETKSARKTLDCSHVSVCGIKVKGKNSSRNIGGFWQKSGSTSEGPGLVVNGGMLKEVEQFCYLGGVLDCEGVVKTAVRAIVTALWRRWQEIASLLVNHSIRLRTRGRVHEACVRSTLLYGAETWALTSRLMDILHRCDCRMLRYMTGMRWQDGKSGSEVAEMSGIKDLSFEAGWDGWKFLLECWFGKWDLEWASKAISSV